MYWPQFVHFKSVSYNGASLAPVPVVGLVQIAAATEHVNMLFEEPKDLKFCN